MICKETKEIICIFFGEGREHDFSMFKASGLEIAEHITVYVDKGYTGIKEFPTAI